VTFLNTTLIRFFCISIALHIVFFSFMHLRSRVKITPQDRITVALLPAPDQDQGAPKATQNIREARSSTKTVRAARKESPVIQKRRVSPETPAQTDLGREPPIAAMPAPAPAHQPIHEKTVIAERELPTVKDLLPPLTWSSSNSRVSSAVSLNTKDPVFVTYFNRIKQSIESQWEYPELALRYGLQGKLSLEFTIANDGQLAQLRLIRSSGSQLLDEEAIRAIKAAAPFPPIPSWIKLNPLPISASMEYHDNRVDYRFTR
jgi:protein TonB